MPLAAQGTTICRHCLGTSLRPISKVSEVIKIIGIVDEIGSHQCAACLNISDPLIIKQSQDECPICNEQLFVRPELIGVSAEIANKLVPRQVILDAVDPYRVSPRAFITCKDCHVVICGPCSNQMKIVRCVYCKHQVDQICPMMFATMLDTMPVDNLCAAFPGLRILIADFALVIAIKSKGDKQPTRPLFGLMIEYLKWLLIIKNVPDDPNAVYAPSPIIDELWHTHILQTANYVAVCNVLCSRFIHHRTVFSDAKEKQGRFATTVGVLRKIPPFTEFSAEVWGIPMQSAAFNLEPSGVILVKTLSGRSFTIEFHPQYTIGDIILKTFDENFSYWRIHRDGRQCSRIGATCAEYGIVAGSVLTAVLLLSGC